MLAWAAMKADDFLSPFCIFSGTFALYNGLLLIRLSSPEVQSHLVYPVLFSPEDYCQAGLVSAISAITIALTWLACRKLGVRQEPPKQILDFAAQRYYTAGFIGVLVGFAVKMVGFWQAGGVFAYLTTSRVELFDSSSPQSIGLPAAPFVVAGLSLMTYATGTNLSHAKLLWTSVAAWTVVLLLQGDRRPILQVIIAILFAWSATRQRKLKVRLSAVLMLFILYVCANVFAQFRFLIPAMLQSGTMVPYGASRAISIVELDWIMPENTEFCGPYLFTLSAVSDDSRKLYGGSYVTGLLGVIPRPVYPGTKPTMLGQNFANQMATGSGPASGWGFNPGAEAYMNFGWLGVVVLMFVWALAFIAMNRLRDLRPLGLMIGAALASEAVNVNRIDFSNVCSESVQCSVAAVIVYSLVVVSRKTRKGRTYQSATGPECRVV